MFGRTGYYYYLMKNSEAEMNRIQSSTRKKSNLDEEIWTEFLALLRLAGVIMVATTAIALILLVAN